VSGIGPGGKSGDDVELSEEFADDLVSVVFGAEPVELSDDFQKSLLDIVYRSLGEELALLFETALTLQKFFAVEVGEGMEARLTRRARIGQEAGETVPRRSHYLI
jgi:hypothetical protein